LTIRAKNQLRQFNPNQGGGSVCDCPNNVQRASFVPGKLIKQVAPSYPSEARAKGIQGTVTLNVILRKDGSITVQSVAEGDPILSPSAIKAVRQWATSLPCLTVSRLTWKRKLMWSSSWTR